MAFREVYLADCRSHALQLLDVDPAAAITTFLRQASPIYDLPPGRLAAASGFFRVTSRIQVREWLEAFR